MTYEFMKLLEYLKKKRKTHKQFKAFIRHDTHWISELKKHWFPIQIVQTVCTVKKVALKIM